MIDFATLQGLTIPEGVVTQIADASGRVIWALSGGKVILEVEKITADTYAGETTYTGEQFILLDIYPKTNGTVKITYGGLTKTITDTSGAAEPNAQQVFFGTFNGVSDSVETPASGELTIECGWNNFKVGTYKTYENSKETTDYCGCITNVVDWGNITFIAGYAFSGCTNLALTSLPNSLTSIGARAFYKCTNLALTSLPNSLTSIGESAFDGCTNLALTSLPNSLTSIEESAFDGCTNLALTSLPSGLTSIGSYAFYDCTNLALTSLPSGLTSIGSYAFFDCKKISIQVFPEGLLSIGQAAFYMLYDSKTAMYGLTILLPSTLQSIGASAFMTSLNASGTRKGYLAGAKILATTPPTLTMDTNGVFGTAGDFASTFKIIVPVGCGDTYKAAEGWSEYADRIVEAS